VEEDFSRPGSEKYYIMAPDLRFIPTRRRTGILPVSFIGLYVRQDFLKRGYGLLDLCVPDPVMRDDTETARTDNANPDLMLYQ
jgi:hypothetical protein